MTLSLLATKLHIPPARPQLVLRARLIEQLDAGLRQGRRLSLVSAPAGFGKTTLISQWLTWNDERRTMNVETESPHSSLIVHRFQTAWLSLDAGDNDPTRFLGYLIAAFQQVDPDIGRAVLPLLQAAQPPPPQAILTALINDSAGRAEPLILVLDDYHLLVGPDIHEMVGFLLEHMPPMLHLVIGTREDPPLPLPRLRARGQTIEIRQRDLSFTAEEAATFLRETMRLPLTTQAITTLQARTEGWPTGLQLAALALQSTPEQAEQFIAAFAGDDRYVMDYLIDEVLDRVPQTVREFLRQTAILDRFTASLCDAVMGRADSRAILDSLETANLFVVALDNRREWYRYHQLFGDVLRLAHAPQEQRDLHWRAAQWHWSQDLAEQAIQHALAYARLTEDFTQAEAWIAEATMPMLAQGALATAQGWLASVPEQHVRADPQLALAKGWLLAMSGNLPHAQTYAEIAQALVQDAAPDALLRAKSLLLSGVIALLAHQDYQGAIGQADAVLELLPDDQAYWRLIALWVKAEAAERSGPIMRAIAAFQAAQAAGHSMGRHVFLVTVEMALAGALNHHGRRREALQICKQAIARHTDALGRVAPLAATILSLLGTLYYEANQLELARQVHDQALAYGTQLALPPYQIPAYGMRAPTYAALGEADRALEGLHVAAQLVKEAGSGDAGWLMAREADIRLRQGDLPFAVRWVEQAGLTLDSKPHYLEIDAYMVYVRVLIAQRRLDGATRLLARLRAFLHGCEMQRPLLTVTVLEALTLAHQGQRSAALGLLHTAVQFAAPEEYYRAFLDEGPQVLDLVREVRSAAPAFVDQLLDYAYGAAPTNRAAPQPLAEPLSERELEVLALLAAGYSNAEIAERLVIATGTVKRHLNNMYGKLEVQSRTQAIAKARGLRLLDAVDA
jgi:LuxR family maltose regulon positive regulatory protein